jgi:hypothetical protein
MADAVAQRKRAAGGRGIPLVEFGFTPVLRSTGADDPLSVLDQYIFGAGRDADGFGARS